MKRKRKNVVSKLLGTISFIIYLIFSALLLMLDMLPTKYLLIFFIIFSVLYLIFLMFIFVKKIKKKIRIASTIFVVIFGILFGIGIKYLNDTINFIDIINNELFQKETYYVMVLEKNEIDNIVDLENTKIGIYKSLNSEHAFDELNKEKELNLEYIEYEDVVDMFEDLEENKITAVLINDSVKNLLETDLSDLKLNLKELDKVSITIEKEDIVKIVDVTKKSFNIYIAGGDAFGSINNVTNTDVNMIATVDPVNKKILLTSIPRDYYVNLPSFGDNAYDKLTHAGYYGIEESVKAIENLLDIDINYFVKVNFSTIVGVVDAIGGVDVYSDYNFCVDGRPDVCYKKGINHLDGNRALMFARERYAFKDGDIQRVKNQQKVIEAVIKKATSSTKIITNFSEILDSVSENLSTNMDTKSMNRFVKMQLNDMKMWEIETQNLVGTDYMANAYTFPNQKLYVMKIDEDSVNDASSKIHEFINNNK